MDRIGVMQLVDTLDAGGAERVAVNLANLLPRDRYRSHLATTRRDGDLAGLLHPDVGRLSLMRPRRIDPGAVRRLAEHLRVQRIGVLHAHGTALLVATLAALLPPHPAVVWHDHYGGHEIGHRPTWIYGLLARRARSVIAVTPELASWSRSTLRVDADRVVSLPNFVCETADGRARIDLPGVAGTRIVCVANLRPQKDHLTLIRAMARVARQVPEAHLLLVGATADAQCLEAIAREIDRESLAGNVSMLGPRLDVPDVLRGCDVGVLSSASEGMPLALLEYGQCGLPAVATSVGRCPEILRDGLDGVLVAPASPDALASALLALLRDPQRRRELAARLAIRVRDTFGAAAALERIGRIYDGVTCPETRRVWFGRPGPRAMAVADRTARP